MSAFHAAYSFAPRFAQLSGARQSVSASDSSSRPTRASPTTASDAVLVRVEARGVEADDARVVAEHRPGAGGEILQPRADREHHVGLGRQRVGRGRADDADRADIHRMVVDQRRPAGDGLGDGDVVPLGEGGERLVGQRIVHAAAGDDQRLLRLAQELRRLAERVGVGPRPRDAVDRRRRRTRPG